MKKRISYVFTIVTLVFVLMFNSVSVFASDSDLSYDNIDKICTAKIFEQSEDGYYVYFYRENCSDCNLVKRPFLEFSLNNPVYFVDYSLSENRAKSYDWNSLRAIYNKKVGYLDENEEIVFLSGESYEKYENQINKYGKKITYSFLIVGNDVYSNIMTPEIDYTNIRNADDLVIAGVPTLLYIENNRIKSFYYDSYEILNFLGV